VLVRRVGSDEAARAGGDHQPVDLDVPVGPNFLVEAQDRRIPAMTQGPVARLVATSDRAEGEPQRGNDEQRATDRDPAGRPPCLISGSVIDHHDNALAPTLRNSPSKLSLRGAKEATRTSARTSRARRSAEASGPPS